MTHPRPRVLEGRVAFITGGSRGLGRALCRTFAGEGARVAFTFLRDEEGAAGTLREIAEFGPEGRSFRASVLDREATEAAVREIEKDTDGIDILVNNAGISQNLPVALLEEEDWDRVLDTNLKGAFLTTKTVLRGMIRRRRGVVLNMGSRAGARMLEAPVHYYTSKAGLKGLTEALAKEVARYSIRVICLAPGLLEEGLGRNLPDHRLADYLHHCSLGRVGTLDEVARFAAFLVSDANSFMTGETIIMDGGL